MTSHTFLTEYICPSQEWNCSPFCKNYIYQLNSDRKHPILFNHVIFEPWIILSQVTMLNIHKRWIIQWWKLSVAEGRLIWEEANPSVNIVKVILCYYCVNPVMAGHITISSSTPPCQTFKHLTSQVCPTNTLNFTWDFKIRRTISIYLCYLWVLINIKD